MLLVYLPVFRATGVVRYNNRLAFLPADDVQVVAEFKLRNVFGNFRFSAVGSAGQLRAWLVICSIPGELLFFAAGCVCPLVSLRFGSLRCVSFRFVSLRFDSIRFDLFRFDSIRFDSCCFVSTHFDSVRMGLCVNPFRFGSDGFVSTRFDSVRFGMVRVGSVRFGTVRFGSVRFSSIILIVRSCRQWRRVRVSGGPAEVK